jgi:allophanate hydrolase subunit 2
MGSASTHLGGRFGGLEGRKLEAGDVLHVRRRGISRIRPPKPGALDALPSNDNIRVTRSSQQDWFGHTAFEKLFSSPYVVSAQSDRAGLRLTGESIWPERRTQLLTDGNPLGAIQIPQDGQPIILFVDQQTTGGYPKIATVVAADRHVIGQLHPRDEVRFAEVSIAEALRLLRQQEHWLYNIFYEHCHHRP